MPVYATTADLRQRLELAEGAPDPLNASRYLRIASGLVEGAIASVRYDTTNDGWPVDPGVAATLREATLDQVEAWIVAGIDPSLGRAQVKPPIKQKSLSGGGASVTYGDPDPYLISLASGVLLDAAYARLYTAGLVSTSISTAPAARTYIVGTEYRLTTGELLP